MESHEIMEPSAGDAPKGALYGFHAFHVVRAPRELFIRVASVRVYRALESAHMPVVTEYPGIVRVNAISECSTTRPYKPHSDAVPTRRSAREYHAARGLNNNWELPFTIARPVSEKAPSSISAMAAVAATGWQEVSSTF